VKIAWEPFA